jgi:hypothetical protein
MVSLTTLLVSARSESCSSRLDPILSLTEDLIDEVEVVMSIERLTKDSWAELKMNE